VVWREMVMIWIMVVCTLVISWRLESINENLTSIAYSLKTKRNDDECIKRLGGRYGAAAKKDLQSLKGKK